MALALSSSPSCARQGSTTALLPANLLKQNAVYVAVKSYGCCSLLNFLGSMWCGLLVAGVFGLLLCFVALGAIRTFDRLPPVG